MSWQEKVREERAELTDKLDKLIDFINSPAFLELGPGHKMLLQRQRRVMTEYSKILSARLAGDSLATGTKKC